MSARAATLCICLLLACGQMIGCSREASETLVAKIDLSSWIAESLTVSPDSRRFARAARVGAKWSVIVDGAKGKPYDGIGKSTPIFSPDSKRLAHTAEVGGKQLVVVNGKESERYDGSLAGSRLVFDSNDNLHYLAVKNGNEVYLVQETIK